MGRSTVCNLDPWMDTDKLFRVGDLVNSPSHLNSKEPVLLLSDHPITKLIICDVHQNWQF